jgi:hypothetical protein
MIPFLIAHWICNDNTCVLTIIEKHLRKNMSKKYSNDKSLLENDCFMCRLIEPVYDFNKDYSTLSKYIYILTISLWLITTGKLYCKYKSGTISTWKDFFII